MSKGSYRKGAVELGQTTEQTDLIELLGSEQLIPLWPQAPHYITSATHSLFAVVGLDYKCYYSILCRCEDPQDNEGEQGVGKVIEQSGKFYLQRLVATSYINADGDITPTEGADLCKFKRCKFLIVSTTQPAHYIDAFSAPHSVLASIDPFCPTPIEVEPESLLGRKDGLIQSVDMSELKEMITNSVMEIVLESRRQFRLKARHINLDRKHAALSAPVLRALPVYDDENKPPLQKGVIIYNDDSDCLQYYDGTTWRTLKWMEDDEDTE